MSENLRRLRKLEYEKEYLKLEKKQVTRKYLTLTPIKEEELQKELDRISAEEKRINEEIKMTMEEIGRDFRKRLTTLIEDEINGIKLYSELIEIAKLLELEEAEKSLIKIKLDEEAHRRGLEKLMLELFKTR